MQFRSYVPSGTTQSDPNPKGKLFLLVNNVPKVFHKFLP
jgi:hypothetical protein